jgi:hypothetical protein
MSSKLRGRGPGRPFVKADSPDALSRNNGQWVRRPGHPKPSRLVPGGRLLHPHNVGPKSKQTVPMIAFRLLCGRSHDDVLGTVTIDTGANLDRVLQLIA